jgi:hypothetical protein
MPHEFTSAQPEFRLKTALATTALDALFAGDRVGHDQAAAEVAVAELGDCDVIALAQFSLSPAALLVAEKTGKPVLTTPDTSVMKLRKVLTQEAAAVL